MKKKIFVLFTSNGAVDVYTDSETAYIDKEVLLRNGCHDVKIKSFEIEV